MLERETKQRWKQQKAGTTEHQLEPELLLRRLRRAGEEDSMWEREKEVGEGYTLSLMFLCNIWLAITPTGKPWPERPRAAEDTGSPNPRKELIFQSPTLSQGWVCRPWLAHSQPFCISDPQNNSWSPATSPTHQLDLNSGHWPVVQQLKLLGSVKRKTSTA